MRQPALAPRERIISTAMRLFNANGVHTTGIDRIIDESGVAKKTFYNHFSSKNRLIAIYFSQKDAAWFARLRRFSAAENKSSIERVLGIFDGLKEWFSEPDFYGCPFIKGLSDFGEEKNDPELVKCIEVHFSAMQQLLTELLKEARPKDYDQFVPQVMSLIAGATVVAHASRNPSIADINKAMARTLLEAEPVKNAKRRKT